MDLTTDELELLLLLHKQSGEKTVFETMDLMEKFESLKEKGYICNIISTPTGGIKFNISAKGIDLVAELQNKQRI